MRQTVIRQAITTRYIGPSDFRGSRIVAQAANGKRLYMQIPPEASSEEAHRMAAEQLVERMGWTKGQKGCTGTGQLIQGATKDGYAFVFLPCADEMVQDSEEVKS